MGSPPRGRGKGIFAILALSATGITPAWAGKRCLNDLVDVDWQDHPRVGGEKEWTVHYHRQTEGSPPRGRGKAFQTPCPGWRERITPAWAGKSADENRAAARRPGSPPRGRGKELAYLPYSPVSRITPAWAGKRLKRSHRSGIFISGPIPFHSVLHRPAGSGGSRAGRDGSPAGQPQNTGPA